MVLLKEAAAPLAQQSWFDGAIAWARDSLWLVFFVSAAACSCSETCTIGNDFDSADRRI